MTSIEQRAALQRQIWQIANDVRGTLFYRFISENFASHMEAGDASVDYAHKNKPNTDIQFIDAIIAEIENQGESL